MDGACVSVSGGIKRQNHARKERLGWAPCAPADELVSVWVSRFAGIVCLAIYFFPVSRLVRFAGKATWTLWKPWERPSGGALVAIEELVQDVFQGLLDIVPTFVDATLAFTGVIANLPIIQVFDEKPISEVLMPVLVVTMMGTLYFAFACCCLPHSGYETFGARSVIFHVAFFLALASYHQGIVTDPGGIPDTWSEGPGVEESVLSLALERKKKSATVRFCAKERKFKPDRAHYCQPLKRNILRMDHYCPWLSNCVGYYNHKHFLLFLFYTVGASDLVALTILQSLVKRRALYNIGELSLMLGAAFLALTLSCILSPFLVFHCWMLSKNLTTIEYCEFRNAKELTLKYDVGILHNLQTVLGKQIWLWPLPVGVPPGDGVTWQRAAEHVGRSEEINEVFWEDPES